MRIRTTHRQLNSLIPKDEKTDKMGLNKSGYGSKMFQRGCEEN